jgi:MerR family transcriptional regulator, mercuric resistance operon regulatory protein
MLPVELRHHAKACSYYRLKPYLRSERVALNGAIQIGELSRRAGCNIETIRYYERVGLLPSPLRSASRYRLYDDGDVRRLTFVRRAREVGFALEEIRTLLALSVDQGKDTCAEVRQLAAGHLADVRAKIADLRAMERMLSDAVRRCDAGEPAGCPLIEALSAA